MTLVAWLTVQHSEPGDNGDIETANPSLEQVLDAIARMDGWTSSYVIIRTTEDVEDVYLTICGGTQGYFWVSYWDGELAEDMPSKAA